MAWAGVDRGITAAEHFGLRGPVDRWRALREQIHAEVLTKGFDSERGTAPGADPLRAGLGIHGQRPPLASRTMGACSCARDDQSQSARLNVA